MTSLYPVQEASEEGLHPVNDRSTQQHPQSADSYPQSIDTYTQQAPERASILPQGSLVDGALTPVNSPVYTKDAPGGTWRSESKSKYTLAGPSGSTMQEMDSLLAAEKVLEAELVGIDSDLLHKLPPEVARQLSQRAIVTAAAQTAGNGTAAPMDLLRRTTSKNSGRESLSEHQQYAAYEHPGALRRNLSVNTTSSRRVSKTPSSVAAPSDGWRFTNDEVASQSQNTWHNPAQSGAAAFKGLNYGSNSAPQQQMDPAGLKYATKQVQQEYRHLQEAGEEEEPPQWNVHQHVAPVTDSQAAEMYHKSMDWRQRNKLRYAEMRREMLAEELAKCTFSPKVNKSSKRMAESARRPKTARGSPSISPSPPKQNLPSATQGAKKRLDFHNGKRPSTAPYGGMQQQQQQQAADTVSEGAASAMSCATAAGRELYERGMEMKQRQEQIREQLRKAEAAEYKAQSPHAARLSPQIYGLGVQQRVESMRANAMTLSHTQKRLLHDPSLAECTFRPHTNFTLRRKARPASAMKEQAPGAAFDLSEYADLLASPESQRGSPGDAQHPEDHEGGLAALAQLASPASSRPASRSRGSAQAQLADVESSSWDHKEQRSPKYNGISADLDFKEFLQRQRRFLEDKKSKVEHELDAHQQKMRAGGLSLSQGTRRILQERERNARKAGQAAAAMTGMTPQATEELSGGNLIERLESELVAQTAALDDLLNPGTNNRKATKQAEVLLPEEKLMTYKPVISKRAHELPARSFEELSEGDRLRHACYVEHMRLEALKKEEAELTFKPKINKYHDVRAQLNLRHPEAYLAQVHAKRQAQLAQRLEERRLMEERELQECTFSPKITTMPAYMQRSEDGMYSSMTGRSNAKYAERAAQRTVDWV